VKTFSWHGRESNIYCWSFSPKPNCYTDYAIQPTCSFKYNYLLIPCSRVLLENLTSFYLEKEFPAFCWTRRFITAFTSARHLSVSWTSPIQSTPPHLTSWRSILILSSYLRLGLPSGLFPSGFPTKPYTRPSPPPPALHAAPISFFSILSPVQYLVRSTDHEAPRYDVFSVPLLCSSTVNNSNVNNTFSANNDHVRFVQQSRKWVSEINCLSDA
jgi:hypothetical protein